MNDYELMTLERKAAQGGMTIQLAFDDLGPGQPSAAPKGAQRPRRRVNLAATICLLILSLICGRPCLSADLPTSTEFTPKSMAAYWNSQIVVSECVFSMTNNVLKNPPAPKSGVSLTNHVPYYFFSRAQSNAFSLSSGRVMIPQFSSLRNVSDEFRPAFGRWENEYWQYAAPGQMTTATDLGQLKKDGPMAGCYVYEKMLLDVINLGVPTLRRGSVALSDTGDTFKGVMLNSEHVIMGEFQVGNNRHVEKITYRLGKMQRAHFEVTYSPEKLAPYGIPKEIVTRYIYPPNRDLITTYRIEQISFGDAPLPRAAFEPDGLKTFKIDRKFVVTNGVTHLVQGNGVLRPLDSKASGLRAPMGIAQKAIFFAFSSASCLVIGLFWLRNRQKKHIITQSKQWLLRGS